MITARITGEERVMRKVEAFAEMAGRGLQDEIIGLARLVAVSMATSTQPYGASKAAHDTGKRRVEMDIRRVFRTPSSIYQELSEENPDDARAFWAAFSRRDTTLMEDLLRQHAIDLVVAPAPIKEFHDAARGPRGRVKGRARQLVTQSESLRRYIQTRQKMVGFAKAGWAKAADDCGGHRGIMAWASSKHPTAPGGAIITKDPRRPRVVIYNRVSYVSDILPPAYQEQAIQIAYDRAIKRYTTALRAAARRTFAAA